METPVVRCGWALHAGVGSKPRDMAAARVSPASTSTARLIHDARRQREAVGLNRLAQQLGQAPPARRRQGRGVPQIAPLSARLCSLTAVLRLELRLAPGEAFPRSGVSVAASFHACCFLPAAAIALNSRASI